ncbi:MAG: lipoprotein-releasing ABC transporter permease subunit [Rhodospirillaceae bacterium]|jgi:lipoprotein-releasing system permease protein|nr:lipoprotein-releasing ABC transporter permease subunit [Rhodospirillaceae bacterium]
MGMAFEWMISFRYLRARRQEGFISIIAWFSLLGIMLGVATLIIVMSVMNGFREELLTRILGINGHLSIYGDSKKLVKFDELKNQIVQLNNVIKVTPVIEGQVMVSANQRSNGAVVRGMREIDIKTRTIISSNISHGSIIGMNNRISVIIGSRMAQSLGVNVGDEIKLISPDGNITPFGTIPRMKNYTVSAIFNIGMHEYDSSFIFMPLTEAQIFFKYPKSISYLDVMLRQPNQASEMVETINNVLENNFRIFDWQKTNSSFFNAIQVERNVMFLILTLIIIVAAFNIISSLIMLVKDKGRDIAILRTMGATRGMIMRIFFISGASIGVTGTFAGFLLGIAFANNIELIRQFLQSFTGTDLFAAEIYFLSQLPAIVDTSEVLSVVLLSLFLSFLATLYPSWRASSLDPVEALRYE